MSKSEDTSVGFLGCGNMGRAMLAGWLRAGAIDAKSTLVCARTSGEQTAKEHGVRSVPLKTLVQECKRIVLCVKPHQIQQLMDEVRSLLTEEHLVISVAAGWTYAALRETVQPARLIKTMPNVACRLGQGVTLILNEGNTADIESVQKLFGSVGVAELIASEHMFHSATAVAGCGPAYMFMAMEAMSDGAVACGLPRDTALRLAAGCVRGAGAMALDAMQSGAHPGQLKDSVTSPGGITIQAVRSLEKSNYRSALIEAVISASERSEHMSSGKK